MLIIWLEFIGCALIIFYSGACLSYYGDIIAEKTGMGKAWVGIILLASITSLPELANNISSIVYVNAPDLAMGDLFGSCLVNILILAFLDLFFWNRQIFKTADKGHILSASLGVVLLGVAAIGLAINSKLGDFSIVNLGASSLFIAVVYLIGQRMIFEFEKKKQLNYLGEKSAQQYEKMDLINTVIIFIFFAVIVATAGVVLPKIGQQLSLATGLSNSFVGSLFLAVTTSLPEIIVSAFAIRLGALDMAVGNLFGSNVFNMFIIFIDDLFYWSGPIYSNVSQNHIVTALFAIILTAIAVIGLIIRSERKIFGKFSWSAIAIILTYIISIVILYCLDSI